MFLASGWRQMSTNSEVLSVAFLHETMVLFHVVSCRFSLGSIAFPVSLLDGGSQYLNCSWRVYCTMQSSQLEFYSLADISIKPLVDLGISKVFPSVPHIMFYLFDDDGSFVSLSDDKVLLPPQCHKCSTHSQADVTFWF